MLRTRLREVARSAHEKGLRMAPEPWFWWRGPLPFRRSQMLRRGALLVLAVLDEIVDHRGIGQRRGVAEARGLVLSDLAQDAAHDLAGARLGKPGCELDQIGGGDRTDVLAHPGHEF